MKTNHKPKFNIPTPCPKKWDNMEPNGKHKHCLSCKKNVYDFTNNTDKEIEKFIKSKNGEIVCGKMTRNQISNKKKTNSISKIAAFLIPPFLILSVKESKSQDLNTFKTPIAYQDTFQTDSITIKGKVIDKDTKEPLIFALVLLKNTKTHVQSDIEGRFQLKISKNDLSDSILVKFIGYNETSYPLNHARGSFLEIELELQPTVWIGSIVYSKPKRRLKNLFRKRKNKI